MTAMQMIQKLAKQYKAGLITQGEYRQECERVITEHFGE